MRYHVIALNNKLSMHSLFHNRYHLYCSGFTAEKSRYGLKGICVCLIFENMNIVTTLLHKKCACIRKAYRQANER